MLMLVWFGFGDWLASGFKPGRLDVITGGSGHWIQSADAMSVLIEKILVPGAVVSAVTPQEVLDWCREARRAL